MRGMARGWSIAGFLALLSVAAVGGLKLHNATLRVQTPRAAAAEAESSTLKRRLAELHRMQELPAEVLRLRANRDESLRLEAEFIRLNASLPASKPQPEARVEPSAVGVTKAAADWRNVGRNTPAASLETALWAGMGGDVETLASLITFHENARVKAAAALAKMPAEVREKYKTPEEWLALLTVDRIPTAGNMRIMSENRANEGEMRLGVLFFNDHGSPEEKERYEGYRVLAFRPDEKGWKLVVPAEAIEDAVASLQGRGRK